MMKDSWREMLESRVAERREREINGKKLICNEFSVYYPRGTTNKISTNTSSICARSNKWMEDIIRRFWHCILNSVRSYILNCFWTNTKSAIGWIYVIFKISFATKRENPTNVYTICSHWDGWLNIIIKSRRLLHKVNMLHGVRIL